MKKLLFITIAWLMSVPSVAYGDYGSPMAIRNTHSTTVITAGQRTWDIDNGVMERRSHWDGESLSQVKNITEEMVWGDHDNNIATPETLEPSGRWVLNFETRESDFSGATEFYDETYSSDYESDYTGMEFRATTGRIGMTIGERFEDGNLTNGEIDIEVTGSMGDVVGGTGGTFEGTKLSAVFDSEAEAEAFGDQFPITNINQFPDPSSTPYPHEGFTYNQNNNGTYGEAWGHEIDSDYSHTDDIDTFYDSIYVNQFGY